MGELEVNSSSGFFNKFKDYMARDTIGVEIGIYAVSGVVFAVAYHRIRPITKFVKPSSIPRHFIKEKLPQRGVVNRIEPSTSGPLVCINHKPPINILFASQKCLPVKIAGVNVNSNGYSWLSTIITHKKVTFIPLAVHPDYAECQVKLISEFKNKRDLDIGDALVSLGFATTTPPPSTIIANDKLLARYFKNLASVEKKARQRRVGQWFMTIPPPAWPIRFFNRIVHNAMLSIVPQGRRLPQLIR